MSYNQFGMWSGPGPAPTDQERGVVNDTNPYLPRPKAALAPQPIAAPPQAPTELPQSPLAMQAQKNLADVLSQPLNFSGLPQLNYGADAAQGARDAAYSQATSRLDPMFDQREARLKNQLANQGLDPSSEAYANALSQFGRDRNDAYAGAQNAAFGQGLAAQGQQFGQSAQARQMMLAELLQGRSVPLSEYGALTGLDLSKAGYGLDAGRFNLGLAQFGASEDQRGIENQRYQNEAFQRFLADILQGGAQLGGSIAKVAAAPATGGASLAIP